MGTTGLTHTFSFNDKTWIKTVLSTSAYDVGWQQGKWENNTFSQYYRSDFINKYLRAATQVNTKIDSKNSIRSGALFSMLYFTNTWENDYYNTTSKNVGNTSFLQAYTQWKHRFTEKLSLISGIHYSYFALNKSSYFEPRLGLIWDFAPRSSFNLGAGLHSRLEPLGTYMIPFSSQGNMINNSYLTLTRAVHAVAGYTTKLASTLTFKTEIYFQYLFNVPIDIKGKSFYSTINADDSDQQKILQNNGYGKNYGVEFTLDKRLAGKWYLLHTVSLYESEYMPRDGQWLSSRFNGNFITNLTAGKDFVVGKKKTDLFSINIRAFWGGGNRYIPVDLAKSQAQGNEVKIYSLGYSDRGPNYYRLDAGVSFRKNKPRWAWMIKLDIQNVTNHLNEIGRKYDAEQQKMVSITHLGLLPALKYRVEF